MNCYKTIHVDAFATVSLFIIKMINSLHKHTFEVLHN